MFLLDPSELPYGRIVLSAPASTRFLYGAEQGVATEIAGIRCEEVDFPKQETYALSQAGGTTSW